MSFNLADLTSGLVATTGEVITCKAAVAYEPNKPFTFEDIYVAPPGPTEVRIKMTNAAMCQSDLYYLKGKDEDKIFPRILGHEGAGLVESVGNKIKRVKPGDKVIPVWQAECQTCPKCRSGRTNICDTFVYNWNSGLMPADKKTTRFSRVSDGAPIYHFFGTSCFSQYTVVDEACVTKINPEADLSKVCLLGCGVSTGIGSAWNIAQITPGSTVAVFGLGTIGLAVIEGAKVAGAVRIIGIDRHNKKFKQGMDFGLTDTIDCTNINKPVEDVIRDMTGGAGVDFSFDCTGNPDIIYSAMDCANPAGGVAVILGLVKATERVSFHPGKLLWGKSWKSGLFGGYKGVTQLPGLVDKCVEGVINLDHYITHKLPFSEINKAMELLDAGDCLRCVMDFEK
jgi:S-(hydroxymethyl)glutathione dehydrogenase/alcohol dehydrogenase